MTLKPINPKALLYHCFENPPLQYALYDDELGLPVAYGSRNYVEGAIRNLGKHVTVIVYKKNIDRESYVTRPHMKRKGISIEKKRQ
jgi:hypothetical protein